MVLKEEPHIYRKFSDDIQMEAHDIDGHGTYEIHIIEFGEVVRCDVGKISDVKFIGELAYTRADMLNRDERVSNFNLPSYPEQ